MKGPRRRWTSKEDQILTEGFNIQRSNPTGPGNTINWSEIAKNLPTRSNKECRKRYLNEMAGAIKKGPWSREEDEKLKKLIGKHGCSWVPISEAIGTRNADQCSKRWNHCLNPDLDRQPWSKEDERMLLMATKTHGSCWKEIQERHFPMRSANNIKNQHTILQRRVPAIDMAMSPDCCPDIAESETTDAVTPMPPTPYSGTSPDINMMASADGIRNYTGEGLDMNMLDEDYSYGTWDETNMADFSATAFDPPSWSSCNVGLAPAHTWTGMLPSPDQTPPGQEKVQPPSRGTPALASHGYNMELDAWDPSYIDPAITGTLDWEGTPSQSESPPSVQDPNDQSRMTIVIDEAPKETLGAVMQVLMNSQARVEFRRG